MVELLISLFIFILGLLGTLLVISVIIIAHEMGHYMAARMCGLVSHSVNIGFGRVLFTRKDHLKTLWQFRIWPLGGFVDLCGQNKRSISKFVHLSYLKKMFIMFGGILVNVIFAIFLFSCCNFLGLEYKKTKVGSVIKSSIAEKAGIIKNDQIIMMNNDKILSWRDVAFGLILSKTFSDDLSITVLRSGKAIKLKSVSLSDFRPNSKVSLITLFGVSPIYQKVSTIIDQISANSPAERSGLKTGDVIESIDGIDARDARVFLTYIRDHPDKRVDIVYSRNENQYKTSLHLESKGLFEETGYLGISIQTPKKQADLYASTDFSFFESIYYASYETYRYVLIQCATLYLLFSGALSLQMMGGPVIIMSVTYSLFSLQNIITLLNWMGIINISLAFINLLPIPVFDGGRMLILTIEKMIGRPIKPSTLGMIDRIAFSLLLGFFGIITYNDIMRVFGVI